MRAGKSDDVVVIGAGVFGGWTALNLLRSGAKVTLIEAQTPGNLLSSSGGESRCIRHAYADRIYVDMASRSLELWQQADQDWGQDLLHASGVLFMSDERAFIDQATSHMQQAGLEFEQPGPADLHRYFPGINSDDLVAAIYEPQSGFLRAARACAAVKEALVDEGGRYMKSRVRPGAIGAGVMQSLTLENGEVINAGTIVFACGPWLKFLFPEILTELLVVSRQEVYFFRPPDECFNGIRKLPVWADISSTFWYGIPTADGLFKIATDQRGPDVNPDTQSRAPTADGIAQARAYLAHRFPGTENSDLVDARVCQYTNTPDSGFIMDQHPEAANVWLIGGGSGHGFKHGPAMGEMTAHAIMGHKPAPAEFSLERFTRAN